MFSQTFNPNQEIFDDTTASGRDSNDEEEDGEDSDGKDEENDGAAKQQLLWLHRLNLSKCISFLHHHGVTIFVIIIMVMMMMMNMINAMVLIMKYEDR